VPAVNDTVWAAENTTPAAIEPALRELLIERHNESDGYVPARVLNMICIVGASGAARSPTACAASAATTLAHDRLRLSDGRPRSTAVATSPPMPHRGGQHVLTHETVILDVGMRHLEHLESIVDPSSSPT